MADEQQKRRRGRRRGGSKPSGPPESGATQPEAAQPPDTGAPSGGVTPPLGDTSEPSEKSSRTKRERRPAGAAASRDVSPMDFWRSGSARSHRQRPVSTVKGPRGLWKRITNMYFPPWVPVVGIIFVVFGILALLFVTRNATGAPRIGKDHWHATYTFYACGDKQPNAPTWEGVGVHTHGDGVIHIHPFTASEEGSGARLVKWFNYGGGQLDGSHVRLPGLSKTWKNGEVCPEGTPNAGQEGKVQVFVNSVKLKDYSRYIPKDGDRVRIEFGPEDTSTQLTDRLVIPDTAATREIAITVSGDESLTQFAPSSLQLKTGEAVKITLTNDSDVSHGMRFAGDDGEYDTGDDFVVVPTGSNPVTADQGDVIQPHQTGFAVVRFDAATNAGQFKDPTASNPATPVGGGTPEPFATGTVIVTEAGSGTPSPTPSAQAELAVEMQDNKFVPDSITIQSGELSKITLNNTGEFVHNFHIADADGNFVEGVNVSPDVDGAATLDWNVTIEEPGEYKIQDDFHTEMTATLIVE